MKDAEYVVLSESFFRFMQRNDLCRTSVALGTTFQDDRDAVRHKH